MRLTGARVASGPRAAGRRDVTVRNGRILLSVMAGIREKELDLTGYLLLPGLINSHDHLEFNLFPRLGQGIYSNAREWAADIFHPDVSPVREHLSIPMPIRLVWGGLRNLLSGVTTVAHHNPCSADVFEAGFPVRVLRHFGWAHSLDFSPDLADRYHNSPRNQPFILHAAEGIDQKAVGEILRLDAMGVLSPRTVLVHGLAIARPEIELLLRRRSSVIWCPGSNLAMFARTLSREALSSGIPIALGTDSALSFAGDMADELSTASQHGVTPEELYRMVTSTPASILRLRDGRGWIRHGGAADLVAVEDHGQTPAEALLELRPKMVMTAGRIRLLSGSLPRAVAGPLNHIHVEGRGDYYVDVDVRHLDAEARHALGSDYTLAGRRVAA